MKNVVLIVFDFDGVMTDNRVLVHQSGQEGVWCHRGDGWGIARLKEAGVEVLVLSTERNPVVAARCRKLGIEAVQGCDDKLAALQRLARGRNLGLGQIAYVGNDLNDLACMQWVGWPIAVADAVPEVRGLAKWVTRLSGGRGAVREVADRFVASRQDDDPGLGLVHDFISESTEATRVIASSKDLVSQIMRVARTMTEVLRTGGRIFFFGNGDNAPDVRQLAAEVTGRLMSQRRGLPAIALTVDTSSVTATGNYSDDLVLARQLEARARRGDMAVGLTTVGNSPDVVRALETAHQIGLRTAALTGAHGGLMATVGEECICVPVERAALLREAHTFIGRILAKCVERSLSGESNPHGSAIGVE